MNSTEIQRENTVITSIDGGLDGDEVHTTAPFLPSPAKPLTPISSPPHLVMNDTSHHHGSVNISFHSVNGSINCTIHSPLMDENLLGSACTSYSTHRTALGAGQMDVKTSNEGVSWQNLGPDPMDPSLDPPTMLRLWDMYQQINRHIQVQIGVQYNMKEIENRNHKQIPIQIDAYQWVISIPVIRIRDREHFGLTIHIPSRK